MEDAGWAEVWASAAGAKARQRKRRKRNGVRGRGRRQACIVGSFVNGLWTEHRAERGRPGATVSKVLGNAPEQRRGVSGHDVFLPPHGRRVQRSVATRWCAMTNMASSRRAETPVLLKMLDRLRLTVSSLR